MMKKKSSVLPKIVQIRALVKGIAAGGENAGDAEQVEEDHADDRERTHAIEQR